MRIKTIKKAFSDIKQFFPEAKNDTPESDVEKHEDFFSKYDNLIPLGLVFFTKAEGKISGFFMDMIRIFTGSKVWHVEILLYDKKTHALFTAGSHLRYGVAIREITNAKEFLKDKWVFMLSEEYIKNPHFRVNVLMKIAFTVGNKYDIMAILTYPFKNVINYKNRYYCSEYCYEIFKRSSLEIVRVMEPERVITPKDLTFTCKLDYIESDKFMDLIYNSTYFDNLLGELE